MLQRKRFGVHTYMACSWFGIDIIILLCFVFVTVSPLIVSLLSLFQGDYILFRGSIYCIDHHTW